MINPANSILNDATALQARLQLIASLEPMDKLALTNETLLTEGPTLENLQQRVQELAQNTQMFDPNTAIDISDTLSNCNTILRELADSQEANAALLSQFDENAWNGPQQPFMVGPLSPRITSNSSPTEEQLERVERQIEREVQDEDFKASEFNDQNKEITASLTGNPELDFEILLPFYAKLKEYVLSKNDFVSDEAESIILLLLDGTENMLSDICEGQVSIEAEKTLLVQTDNTQIFMLQGLKEALESLQSASDVTEANSSVNQVFAQLSIENKELLLSSLQTVLRENGKIKSDRKLPLTWLSQSFTDWSASVEHKLAALESILPPDTINNSDENAGKKSEEMLRRLEAVKTMVCTSSPVINSSPVVITNSHIVNQTIPSSNWDTIEQEAVGSSLMTVFGELLSEALTTTDTEQRRALQRTMVEVALSGVEEAINFGDEDSLIRFLDYLQQITLDPADQFQGQAIPAFVLYGAFYHVHAAARVNNPSLIDPNDGQFRSNFGKLAFRSIETIGVDNSLKLVALQQVKEAFRGVWGT